jgi:hypothetical protein
MGQVSKKIHNTYIFISWLHVRVHDNENKPCEAMAEDIMKEPCRGKPNLS